MDLEGQNEESYSSNGNTRRALREKKEGVVLACCYLEIGSSDSVGMPRPCNQGFWVATGIEPPMLLV
jgi:hypothetical protein